MPTPHADVAPGDFCLAADFASFCFLLSSGFSLALAFFALGLGLGLVAALFFGLGGGLTSGAGFGGGGASGGVALAVASGSFAGFVSTRFFFFFAALAAAWAGLGRDCALLDTLAPGGADFASSAPDSGLATGGLAGSLGFGLGEATSSTLVEGVFAAAAPESSDFASRSGLAESAWLAVSGETSWVGLASLDSARTSTAVTGFRSIAEAPA